MKGLAMMLKALGIEIPEEQLVMIQAMLPQLPAKLNEASQAINAALLNFDARLKAIEMRLDIICSDVPNARHHLDGSLHAVNMRLDLLCEMFTEDVLKEQHTEASREIAMKKALKVENTGERHAGRNSI
jgi:hypothetical protein